MEHADAVICDLPVGYYPDDESARAFELKADEGHSFHTICLLNKA
ncbi:hypothetical protein PO124_09590 [Bacillus licheniformis]|nr:hypothetical protein [Bacillus licheniformis]